jgi:hypothetical protein
VNHKAPLRWTSSPPHHAHDRRPHPSSISNTITNDKQKKIQERWLRDDDDDDDFAAHKVSPKNLCGRKLEARARLLGGGGKEEEMGTSIEHLDRDLVCRLGTWTCFSKSWNGDLDTHLDGDLVWRFELRNLILFLQTRKKRASKDPAKSVKNGGSSLACQRSGTWLHIIGTLG